VLAAVTQRVSRVLEDSNLRLLYMGFYVTVKGGAPLQEINRLCGIAIGVVESWRVGAK